MLSKRDSEYQQQKSPVQRFLFVLGILFLLLYIGLGLMLIFWKEMPVTITYNGRLMWGCLIILYAFFRFYRLLKNSKQDE